MGLIEILESLSGKKLEFLKKTSERIQDMYTCNFNIISYMILQGALLSSVRPEFLFSLNEYHEYIEGLGNNGLPSQFELENCRDFNTLSNEAWTMVLLQLVKVYALPSSNIQLIEYNFEEFLHPGGNIVDESEMILINWAIGCLPIV